MFSNNRFSQIRNSKEAKVLIKNFSYLTILQVSNYIFPFITLPYLARVLGVDAFGLLAIGTAIIAYFQTLIDYGFNYSSVRDIARCKDDKFEINRIVSETLFSRIFLLLVSIAIITIALFAIPFFKANSSIIICSSTLLIGYAFTTEWFFQAVEDMRFITITSVFSNLIFTLLVFVLVKEKSDYLLQPILNAIGIIISSSISWYVIRKRFCIQLYKPNFKFVWKRLKDGFDLFISLFFPTIYSNLNTLLLGSYNGKTATGIYSGGAKFTSIAYSITMLFSRVFYPYLSRSIDKHKMYAIVSLSLGLILSLIFYFGAEIMVQLLLSPEFKDSVAVLKIVSFAPLAMSVYNVYGTNYLALQGGEKYLRNIVIGTTVFGICAGIYCAVEYSYRGVAFVSIMTQIIRALASYLCAIKISKTRNNG